MKRSVLLTIALIGMFTSYAQVNERIQVQVQRLLADSQMKHAILGFYVADAKTGAVIAEHNSQVGLAPASTQKVFTSVAAFELLGAGYRYQTQMGYVGSLDNESLQGDLVIRGFGDPSFGSNRYAGTTPSQVFGKIMDYLQRFRVKRITGDLIIDASALSYQSLPGGWIWDDIGNYYGAGNHSINWRENQYDLLLKPGKKAGDSVTIVGTDPNLIDWQLSNRLVTGKTGSGDNAYIYFPPLGKTGFVEGSFEGDDRISGALPDPAMQFGWELMQELKRNNIVIDGKLSVLRQGQTPPAADVIFAHHSPLMDSIVYWFMQRSINLYGEALVKTIGLEKAGTGSADSGVAVIRRWYREQGIASSAELKIIDGSGLSPSNRVTAASLGRTLVYARNREWFPAFAASFPTYNRMRLKSGTIRGAKSFAGYHTAADGNEYVVAIIVNNYDGTATSIVNKMFKVLDVLK